MIEFENGPAAGSEGPSTVQKGAETLKRWTANSLYFVQGYTAPSGCTSITILFIYLFIYLKWSSRFAKKAAQASKEVAAEIKAKEGAKASGADHMKRGADLFEVTRRVACALCGECVQLDHRSLTHAIRRSPRLAQELLEPTGSPLPKAWAERVRRSPVTRWAYSRMRSPALVA